MKPSRPLTISAVTVVLLAFLAAPVSAAESPVPTKNEPAVKNELPNGVNKSLATAVKQGAVVAASALLHLSESLRKKDM